MDDSFLNRSLQLCENSFAEGERQLSELTKFSANVDADHIANYLCFEYVIETKGRVRMVLEFGMFSPPSYAASLALALARALRQASGN